MYFQAFGALFVCVEEEGVCFLEPLEIPFGSFCTEYKAQVRGQMCLRSEWVASQFPSPNTYSICQTPQIPLWVPRPTLTTVGISSSGRRGGPNCCSMAAGLFCFCVHSTKTLATPLFTCTTNNNRVPPREINMPHLYPPHPNQLPIPRFFLGWRLPY